MYEQSLGDQGKAIDLTILNLTTERDAAQRQCAALTTQLADATVLNEALKATITAKNKVITDQAAEIARLNAIINPPPPVPTMPWGADPAGWVTTAYDLFDKSTLDPKNWTIRTGPLGAPREEYNRAENIKTGSGLVIATKREPYGGKQWTSAYIDSANLALTFDINSRIECEAVLPDLWDNAAGLWPCPLWFRWGTSGEIDAWEAYGYPFGPARTNTAENTAQRGCGSGTIHNDTMGGPAKTVRQPVNAVGGLVKGGEKHIYGMEFTDAGVTLLLDGKPMGDLYNRPNPVTWAQLAANSSGAILKSNFTGKGHLRIQTQVGSGYWGPSNAQTKNAEMKINWVRIMRKA